MFKGSIRSSWKPRHASTFQERVRAGVREQGTVDLLIATGVGDRLKKQGLIHHGIEFRFNGRRHRIPLSELTGGRAITIYGQNELVKDLTDATAFGRRQNSF